MKAPFLTLTLIAALAAGEALAQTAAAPNSPSGGSGVGSGAAPQSVGNGGGSSGAGSSVNVGATRRTVKPGKRRAAKTKTKTEPEKAIPRPVAKDLGKKR